MSFLSRAAAVLPALALAACTNVATSSDAPNAVAGRVINGQVQPGPPGAGAVQTAFAPVRRADVDAFARSYLSTAQALSFRDRVEYCGFFFQDAAGTLQSTTPRAGEAGSCAVGTPPPGVVAGWHTHSAFDPTVIGEVPSPRDLMITFQIGLDGYVATPGGRLWRMNAQARNTVQVCGTGCLLSDPRYFDDPRLQIRNVYTLPSLLQSLGVSAANSSRVIIEN